MEACLVLHNISVLAWKSDSNIGMCELEFVDEPAVRFVLADDMRYSKNDILSPMSGSLAILECRVAKRYNEGKKDLSTIV